jgi:indolepyruvate ferredoxin oxidoreductase alpha subunit
VWVNNGNPARGIITMGLPFLSLMEVLAGRSRRQPDIMKLAYVHPLPRKKNYPFSLQSPERSKSSRNWMTWLENQIKAMAFDQQLPGEDRRQNAIRRTG